MTSLLSGRHKYLTNKNTKKGRRCAKLSHFLPLKTDTAGFKSCPKPFFWNDIFFSALCIRKPHDCEKARKREKNPRNREISGVRSHDIFFGFTICIAPPKKISAENPYGIRDFGIFDAFFAASARFKQNHRNYSVNQKRYHFFFESNCPTCVIYYSIFFLVLQWDIWKKQPVSTLITVQVAFLLIPLFLPRYTRRRRWPRCAYRRTPWCIPPSDGRCCHRTHFGGMLFL